MFIFVSDLFLSDYVGGGELTTDAIINGTKFPVNTIHSGQITKEIVTQFKDRHWIFGNFANMSTEMILYCCKNLNYSVIEYDYKYCKYRLPLKHKMAEGSCECESSSRGKMVSIFYSNASSMWFMSEAQRQVYYDKFPFLKKKEMSVLSSVFSVETLKYIASLDISNKNDTWLIQKSDSWVKGTQNAIKYAEENNIKYELFSGLSYEEMLAKFASYKGFLFLPNSFDTCPRTVIEAKLLGCDLILNEGVQHKDEEWFLRDPNDIVKYLSSRNEVFWNKMYEIANERIPYPDRGVDLSPAQKTHFKIIIPVYNARDYVGQSLNSVIDQKYENYECIISDDVSTDGTWDIISSFDGGPKIKKHRNSDKKYALKNIYDSIEMLNPRPDDVIVILDGDDWFSNEYVLNTLNRYYLEEKCEMTYGSFVRFPDGVIGPEASEYSEEVIKNKNFREDNWRASHLKTYKYSLWKEIDPEDLKSADGSFYEVSYDQAMMFPMLEMSQNKSKYIPEIMYVYNLQNPNAVSKTKIQKQARFMREIRAKDKYPKTEREA